MNNYIRIYRLNDEISKKITEHAIRTKQKKSELMVAQIQKILDLYPSSEKTILKKMDVRTDIKIYNIPKQVERELNTLTYNLGLSNGQFLRMHENDLLNGID